MEGTMKEVCPAGGVSTALPCPTLTLMAAKNAGGSGRGGIHSQCAELEQNLKNHVSYFDLK